MVELPAVELEHKHVIVTEILVVPILEAEAAALLTVSTKEQLDLIAIIMRQVGLVEKVAPESSL
jgi:hypothetical protein